MPIGQAAAGLVKPDRIVVTYEDAFAGEAIAEGQAVAIVDVAGVKTILLCGATTHADRFFGFADASATIGNRLSVITGRGSRVRPLLEGGGSMVTNQRVYLSLTPGSVTQTAPTPGPGVWTIPVGTATSGTEMTLLLDSKAKTP